MKLFRGVTALIAIGIFLLLFVNFTHDEFVEFDRRMSELLLDVDWITFFHWFGEPWFIATVSILLIIFLAIRRNYLGTVFVVLTVGVGFLWNQLLKNWIHRARPDMPHQLISYSFPSGHAMVGALYVLTVAYFITHNATSRMTKIIVWIVAVAFFLLIGLSRVAGNRHYASDVLAGWSMGYACFALVALWYEWRKSK